MPEFPDHCLEPECGHALTQHNTLGWCNARVRVPDEQLTSTPDEVPEGEVAPIAPIAYHIEECKCPGLRL